MHKVIVSLLSVLFIPMVIQAGAVNKIALGAQKRVATRATWTKVQKQVERAVMQVFSQTAEPNVLKPYRIENGEARGTAFFISACGKILTNYHVVAGAVSVTVQMPLLFGKKMIEVDIKGVCPERDIALLQLREKDCQELKKEHGSVPYLKLGDSSKIDRSDELLALGFPLGQESLKSVTGVVSGEEHISIHGGSRTIEANCVQVSTPINPGSSGGPALNLDGEVVGINTAGIGNAQNVGYILPISEYKLIAHDLETKKIVRKPYLGGAFCPAENDELAQLLGNPVPGGCYITKVYPYGWMREVGLESGDMIYDIDGHRVDVYGYLQIKGKNDRMRISDYICSLPSGQECVIRMYRNGQEHSIKAPIYCPEEPPIRWKYFHYDGVDYEFIGGMLLQELSLNIISFFNEPEVVQHVPNVRDYLSRYVTNEKERIKPLVIITQILSSSPAHRTRAVGLGEIITEVNGKAVSTLQDVRDALRPENQGKFITFKTRDDDLIAFNLERVLQDEVRLSGLFNYRVTPLMAHLLKYYNVPY